eukprot:GILK01015328.1.p1 GENE.GILK01015328.1~~GILK01015328.1.p1  ORF type:complete len:233 (+),score=28.02 GILK01015328.1:77-775(+)
MSRPHPPLKTRTNVPSSKTQPSKRVIVNKTFNQGTIPSQASSQVPVRSSTPDRKPANALSRITSTPSLPTPQAVAAKKKKKPLVMDVGCGEDDIQIAVSNKTIAWYVEGEKLAVKSIVVDGKVERAKTDTTRPVGQKQSNDAFTIPKGFVSAITEQAAKNALVDYLEEDNTLRVIMRLDVGESCSATVHTTTMPFDAGCDTAAGTVYHLTAWLDCAQMECRLSFEAYEHSFL